MIQRTLAAIAQRQLGLITHDQAKQLITYRMIERLLDSGRWERVHRNVYRIAGYPVTYEQRVLAACIGAGSDAVASHRSAAWIWGLLDEEPDVVEIAVPRPLQHRLRDVIVHRSTDLERADTTVRQGIPVTNPMRTLVDLAAVAPVGTVARALHRALSSRLAAFDATEATLQRVARRGRRGVRVFRMLLDEQHDNRRPAGVFEAKFSSLARRFALPVPVPELDVLADDGRWIARVDFAYPEAKLFIELDGLEAHGSGQLSSTITSARTRSSKRGGSRCDTPGPTSPADKPRWRRRCVGSATAAFGFLVRWTTVTVVERTKNAEAATSRGGRRARCRRCRRRPRGRGARGTRRWDRRARG